MSPLFSLEGRRERRQFSSKEREYNSKVKCALQKVRHEYRHLKPPVVDDQFGGSPHVDPKYLTVYLLFKDDNALAQAEQMGYFDVLRGAVRDALREECYPQASVADVQIEFASRKSLKRNGGFWSYFR
jgi:secreted Zn-dependent insulinase-like peptidase